MDTVFLLRSISVFLMVVLSVSGCKDSPSDKTPAPSVSVSPVSDMPAVLATIHDDEELPSSDRRITFARQGGGVAYTVGKDPKIYVVHNSKSGAMHEGIGALALSSDGSRVAYTAIDNGKWRFVVDGEAGESFSVLEGPQFSPDSRHVAFQAMKDDLWYLVVDGKANAGGNKRYREYEFSGDSSHIVYIDKVDEKRKGRLVVSDITFKNVRGIATGVTSMFLNADRNAVVAVSRSSAERDRVIQFNFAKPEAVTQGPEFDKVLNIVLAPGGADLAYFGERQGKIYGVFNGQEELLPEGMMPRTTVINSVGKSVGILMSANNAVYLYEMFRNSGRKGNGYDEAEWLVYSSDGAVSAFAARKGKSWCVVVNGKEGPKFDRVVSPKFSPDGKYLVYRARDKGKRFVIVADASGVVLRQHPAYEQVFDVQFTPDGKSVAYGVKDGKKLAWQVEKLDK